MTYENIQMTAGNAGLTIPLDQYSPTGNWESLPPLKLRSEITYPILDSDWN